MHMYGIALQVTSVCSVSEKFFLQFVQLPDSEDLRKEVELDIITVRGLTLATVHQSNRRSRMMVCRVHYSHVWHYIKRIHQALLRIVPLVP